MLLSAAVTLLALAPMQTQLGPAQQAGRSANTLWVVDQAGGGDFTTIQAAIDAADSGDAIEVRPGIYAGFIWESKELVVFGSGTPAPTIESPVEIRSIGPQQSAVLRSFTLRYRGVLRLVFVELESSPGTIWLEDCTFPDTGSPLFHTVIGRDCGNIVLQHCTVAGRPWGSYPFPPLTAFTSIRSTVHAYESEFRGPAKGVSYSDPPTNAPGGHGMTLEDSQLFASGCAFVGGDPGQEIGGCNVFGGVQCSNAAPGGTGLIVDAGSSAESLASTFIGGGGRPAGLANCNGPLSCPAGPTGEPFTGALTTIPLPARSYRVEAPASAAGTYRLSAEGEPGWFLYSVVSERPAGIPFPIYFGTQLTAAPVTLLYEGTIPASGVLEKEVRVPPMVFGTPFVVRFAQGLLFDELANAYLTSGSVLIVR
jgi:hypothetical protein